MGQLFLVRHGQASFGAEDYDRLSALGATQSALLGRWFKHCGIPADRIVSGAMRRHGETAAHCMAAFDTEGVPRIDSLTVDVRLNEFDHAQVMDVYRNEAHRTALTLAAVASLQSSAASGASGASEASEASGSRRTSGLSRSSGSLSVGGAESSTAVSANVEQAEQATERESERSTVMSSAELQRIFALAMERWMSGEHDHDYDESWTAFSRRCVDVFESLTDGSDPAKTIVAFTSGGAIAAICQHLLDLTNKATRELNWSLANTGVTRLLFTKGRRGLGYLNSTAHFDWAREPTSLTYR